MDKESQKLIADLQQENEDLRQRIANMGTQLMGSEKLALLGQMLAGIIHEINTPVAVLKSNSELEQRGLKKILAMPAIEAGTPGDTAKLQTLLQTLLKVSEVDQKACARISEIIQGTRNYMRGDKSEKVPVNVAQVLDDTLAMLSHETRGRIVIHRHYEPSIVSGYPGRLGQVFLNLLINACQAMADKGEIHITSREEQGNVIITISDNGPGIAPQFLEKLFSNSFSTKDSGMGMGLIIVKKMLDLHGGTIRAESTPGKGSSFILTLPQEEKTSSQPQE